MAFTTRAPRSALTRSPCANSSSLLHRPALRQHTRPRTVAAMAQQEEPKSFSYTQLWVSKDGETHFKECNASGFEMKKYADAEQWVLNLEGFEPDKIVWTELPVGNEQPWHPCPQTQFVITVGGKWYVKTTDGTKKEFGKGHILFQDDVKESPAAKVPQHYSGVVGDVPCQQVIVQLKRKPEVDKTDVL